MKYLKQRFNDISITRKLILMSVGGIVVPLLLAFSAFAVNLYGLIGERERTAREDATERIYENVYEFLEDINSANISLSADTELYRTINREAPESAYQSYKDFVTVQSRIRIIPWNMKEVTKVILYHQRDDFPEDEMIVYLTEEIMEQTWFQEYILNRSLFKFNAEIMDDKVYFMSSSHFITYSRAVDTILRQAVPSKNMAPFLRDDYLAGNSVVYLLDEKGQIVARSNMKTNLIALEKFDALMVDKPDRLLYKPFDFKTLTPGWQIVYYYDQSEIRDFVTNRLEVFFFLVSGVLIFSFVVILWGAKAISKRLIGISDTMKDFDEGILLKSDDDNSQDEIGVVVRSYNRMMDQLEELLTEKSNAYDELEATNEELSATNETLATVNQELSASFEEIRIQDIRIKELIYSDLLTGLHNRFSIFKEIEDGLLEDVEGNTAVIFIDVDNFKFINDTYGHDIGDSIIKETGLKLKKFESKDLIIGRFGGDEFLIFARGFAGRRNIIDLLDAINDEFKIPVMMEDRRHYLTISMGVAVVADHGTDRNELIKKADTALYRSKESGRNRYTFYDEAFDYGLERRIVLQNALKEAVVKEEFYLHYQPYVAADTGKIRGFEALIRWYSAELGQVSPYEMVTTAEAMGIIVEIGDWVLEEAMAFIRDINKDRKDKLTISINISAVQLASKDFNERLKNIAQAVGVTPQEVCLEMTETVLIDSFERSAYNLKQLQDLGFMIALDDFGTGYSSLSYFKELPVDVLKIDKSFIDELEISEFNRELIKVMTVIAHSRGIHVTAEGVEHENQLAYLKKLNCDVIQGYLFSKPLDCKDAVTYVKNDDATEQT